MGIDFEQKQLDLVALFGREAPVVLEIGFGMGASWWEMAKHALEKKLIVSRGALPGVGVVRHRPGRGVSNSTCASSATMWW